MQGNYLRKVEKSQTLLLNEQSRQLEQGGTNVYKLGFGQSPFLPPQHVVNALKEHAHRKDYTAVQGLPELREAVAQFHARIDSIDIKPDNVLIAPGSKILIYAIMASFTKADMLVPVPSWVSYIPQAELAGHRVIKIPTTYTDRWRVTPDALEKALALKTDKNVPSLLILNYPGNPDGLTYADEELAALAVMLRKHKVLVISDEIYGMLHHEGKHVSLARHYPEGTIVTGGLSKWCGAGGWRLGMALLPKALEGEFKDTLLGVASETYSCAPLPVQLAACVAYQWSGNDVMDYVQHQRRIMAMLGQACYHKLHNSGIGVHAPQGGFYLFPDFSNCNRPFTTAHDLCAQLLKDTGVALLPGSAFGMEPSHLCARLAYVDFDGTAALADSQAHGPVKALDNTFSQKHFSRVLEGIDRLCDWVQAA